MEEKCLLFSSEAESVENLNAKILVLKLDFEFCELENYERVTLESLPKADSAVGADDYRGRLFGENGQIEFRKVDGRFYLSAIAPNGSEPAGWNPAGILLGGHNKIFFLDDNPEGYTKARINIYRNNDHQVTAAWWQKVW